MKTKWNHKARASYRQIARYINTRFGRKARQDFIQRVDEMVERLQHHPNLGSIDPLYADRSVAYRSVNINGLSKMVYRVEDDIIYIAAFWDCRREPQNQAEQTE